MEIIWQVLKVKEMDIIWIILINPQVIVEQNQDNQEFLILHIILSQGAIVFIRMEKFKRINLKSSSNAKQHLIKIIKITK